LKQIDATPWDRRITKGGMMKSYLVALAVAALLGGAAVLPAALADEAPGSQTAPGAGKTTAQKLAEKYPFLDPDWSSTSFFPPEYCNYLLRIDREDAIYWQIKKWCDKQQWPTD